MDARSDNCKVGTTLDTSLPRRSLCLASEGLSDSLHHGDAGFTTILNKHFDNRESDAAERLVTLKKALKSLNTKLPWDTILEELATLTQAQCAFVSYEVDIGVSEG